MSDVVTQKYGPLAQKAHFDSTYAKSGTVHTAGAGLPDSVAATIAMGQRPWLFSPISPDIALARAWYERQRTLDRLTHQVGLRSWLAARADRVEAIVQAVAVRRLRPLAPLTPCLKTWRRLSLRRTITLPCGVSSVDLKTELCDVERDCRDGLH
jgi:hypothetical protein